MDKKAMQQDGGMKVGKQKHITFEEASQIYYINKEIKHLQKELRDLEAERKYYKPSILSDMPKGRGEYRNIADEFLEKQEKLEDMLRYSLRKLQEERKKIEEFLESVENAEMRLILRLRCINNKSWGEIGKEIGADRTTISKKFYNFFKVSHNSHNNCDNM